MSRRRKTLERNGGTVLFFLYPLIQFQEGNPATETPVLCEKRVRDKQLQTDIGGQPFLRFGSELYKHIVGPLSWVSKHAPFLYMARKTTCGLVMFCGHFRFHMVSLYSVSLISFGIVAHVEGKRTPGPDQRRTRGIQDPCLMPRLLSTDLPEVWCMPMFLYVSMANCVDVFTQSAKFCHA